MSPVVEPGNEIELIAKTGGEVVRGLADESGVFKPTQEFGEYVAMSIHVSRYPKLVERTLRAAKKIQDSGLPRHAYGEIPNPLLKAILMGAAEEEDLSMQERWENLLANALTCGSVDVTKAFVIRLGELEPAEAAQLDVWADGMGAMPWSSARFTALGLALDPVGLAHLVSLGLIEQSTEDFQLSGNVHMNPIPPGLPKVGFTAFGWAFVQACREPRESPDGE